jgi:uncharacterized protein YdhG (YjbR/CyaY superfamily)
MATSLPNPKTVDEYIAQCKPEVRVVLEKIRRTVLAAAPAAEELISYRMPTYKLKGPLLYVAAFRRHIGVFPPVRGDARLEKAVAPYEDPAGNLRFPLDRPIPYDLIEKIVEFRVRQNAIRAAEEAAARRFPFRRKSRA